MQPGNPSGTPWPRGAFLLPPPPSPSPPLFPLTSSSGFHRQPGLETTWLTPKFLGKPLFPRDFYSPSLLWHFFGSAAGMKKEKGQKE